MTKLVLGIIAIGLLQLAFVAYTHLEEPLTVAMLPEQPATAVMAFPSLIPELPPVARDHAATLSTDDEEFPAPARWAEQHSPTADRTNVTAGRSNSTPITRSNGRSDFAPARHARTDDFSTVVIGYTGRQTESASCDPPATNRPKTRSLMAKAAPVVRKPWEFIKAVGSKLN